MNSCLSRRFYEGPAACIAQLGEKLKPAGPFYLLFDSGAAQLTGFAR
jgi:hypothetical protein